MFSLQRYLCAAIALALFLYCPSAQAAPVGIQASDEARSDAGVMRPFTSDPAADNALVGLFIGIDKYPNLKDATLRGCVNDALRMQTIFSAQFGMARFMLLTNKQASQANIIASFNALIEQALAARQRAGKPITVVISYAGHGSQVRDQPAGFPGHDEDSEMDSTWVPAEVGYNKSGSLDGTQEIRDDDIAKLFQQLIGQGCQVVFISDSCNSGTLYRASYAARQLDLSAGVPQGPARSLMPALPDPPPMRGNQPRFAAGFVSFTACRDTQVALEYSDQGNPCGRLSYVLGDILSKLIPGTTYGEIAARVSAKFAENKFSPVQDPQFYSSSGKTDEKFLNGDYAQPFASIVAGSLNQNAVRLNMGSFQGAEPGAQFVFYPGSADLARDRNRLATGRITSVETFACDVTLDDDARRVTATSVASLDAVRFSDYKVYADPELRAPLLACLRELDARKQIGLTSDLHRATVMVANGSGPDSVGIYDANRLPTLADDHPLSLLRADTPENLANHLLYQARLHRFLSLDYNNRRVTATLDVTEEREGRYEKVMRPEIGGIRQLVENDRFTITLRNAGLAKLYFYVLAVDDDGHIEPIYPTSVDVSEPVRGEIETQTRIARIPDGGPKFARARLKIVAADSPVNFRALLAPPHTGMDNLTRAIPQGQLNPLNRLIDDLMYGGELTRADVTRINLAPPRSVDWSSATLLFDVTRAPGSK